jgi:hypothetical protein
VKHKVKQDYAASREKAYPTVEDQLDLLYHGGLEAWRSQITAIKSSIQSPLNGLYRSRRGLTRAIGALLPK